MLDTWLLLVNIKLGLSINIMSGIYLHIKPNGHLEQQTRSHLNFNQYEYEKLDILILVLNKKKKTYAGRISEQSFFIKENNTNSLNTKYWDTV